MILRLAAAPLVLLMIAAQPSLAACPVPGKMPAAEAATHLLPPYPPGSVRSGEHGQTLLALRVGPDGAPVEVAVEKSSGAQRLDDAALSYVQSYWRWQPLPAGCDAGRMHILVGWHIGEPPDFNAALTLAPAQYPAGAVERYETGDTYLDLTLGDGGKVMDGRVAYSSGYADLDDKALALLKSAPGVLTGMSPGGKVIKAQWVLPAPQRDNVEKAMVWAKVVVSSR